MSQNSFDVKEKELIDEVNMKLLMLKGDNKFNWYDLQRLEDKISVLKMDRPWILLAGLSIGAVIGAIVTHFIK